MALVRGGIPVASPPLATGMTTVYRITHRCNWSLRSAVGEIQARKGVNHRVAILSAKFKIFGLRTNNKDRQAASVKPFYSVLVGSDREGGWYGTTAKWGLGLGQGVTIVRPRLVTFQL